MTNKEIIEGLKFTVDMFLFEPSTGETLKEPRNADDKITVDACMAAIEVLERVPCEDCVSRKDVLKNVWVSEECIEDAMNELPSVRPSIKMGRWTYYSFSKDKLEAFKHAYPMCTICNEYGDDTWNYCPNCGAKMEESE